jgi:hypothetical protein
MEIVAVLRGCLQPLFRDFPPGDFGGAGNVGCADYIGMIEMTTLAAQKDSTNKTIAFVYMPAFRARPARVSRIDCDDRNAGQFCLVFNESPEFGERPFRHPISLSLPEPCPLADASQLFDGDAAIRVCGLLNDLFRDAVIGVRLKSTLTTREIFQLAPDTFRSSTGSFPLSRFLLKGTAGPSIVLPDVFDLVACVDLAVAVGGDVDNCGFL